MHELIQCIKTSLKILTNSATSIINIAEDIESKKIFIKRESKRVTPSPQTLFTLALEDVFSGHWNGAEKHKNCLQFSKPSSICEHMVLISQDVGELQHMMLLYVLEMLVDRRNVG